MSCKEYRGSDGAVSRRFCRRNKNTRVGCAHPTTVLAEMVSGHIPDMMDAAAGKAGSLRNDEGKFLGQGQDCLSHCRGWPLSIELRHRGHLATSFLIKVTALPKTGKLSSSGEVSQ